MPWEAVKMNSQGFFRDCKDYMTTFAWTVIISTMLSNLTIWWTIWGIMLSNLTIWWTILWRYCSIYCQFRQYDNNIVIQYNNIMKIASIVTILQDIVIIWLNNIVIIYDNNIVNFDDIVHNIVDILRTVMAKAGDD